MIKPAAYGKMSKMVTEEVKSGRVDVTVTVVFYQSNAHTRKLIAELVGRSMGTVIMETSN